MNLDKNSDEDVFGNHESDFKKILKNLFQEEEFQIFLESFRSVTA